MDRKTQIALGIFVALTLGVFWLYKTPQRGERVGERPRPIPKLTKQTLQAVTVTSKGKTVKLRRKDDKWQVAAPVQYPTDKYAGETMEKKLLELDFGDVVTERKDRHGHFEVDEKLGVRVQVSDGKKTVADFYLGKTESGFTFFRKHGQAKVYQAVGYLRSTFDKELRNWRNRKILTLKRDDIRKLSIATSAGTISLKRSDAKTPWAIESSPIEVKTLDEQAITSALSAISSLSTHDFADTAKITKTGLGEPEARITVTQAGDKTSQLLVGSRKGKDERYVQLLGNKQIFILKSYALKSLLLRPIDFRDKTMTKVAASDILSVTIVKHGPNKETATLTLASKEGTWMANGKAIKGDKKIAKAIDALTALKAASFASKSAAQLGLEAPAWTVTMGLKDDKQIKLVVGHKEEDSAKAVKIDGRSDLFMVRKHVLDRFLLEPKNYK